MAYIIHENQLQQVLEDLRAENPWTDDEVLLSFIVNNPDIQIMKSGKIWDTQKITDYVWWKTEEELNEIFWMTTNELWDVVKDNKQKPTKEEKIDYSKQYDDNQYSKIWKDNIKWFDETEPFMSNAEKVATAYRKLWDEKNKITDEYDSWQGWDRDTYMQKIKSISNAMWEAENSPEFKYLVNHIKENWITWEDKNFSPMVSTTLTDMARHDWSLYWLSPARDTWWRMSNWVLWDVANSWFVRFMQWVTPQKENSLESLPDIYNESNKKIKEIINKNKWDKKPDNQNKETIKADNKKWWQSSIAEDTFTDAMKFGEDVKSWDYVDKRNITLAQHLKAKWLSTPEEIDAYLSKYPSWQNAKQERKDNTIKNLTDKIWPIEKKDKNNDSNKEDKEIKKWDKWDNKWNENNKSNKNVKVWKPGSDWLPDDYSSINWVEEEDRDENLIYDKNWNPVWSKSTKKVSNNDKDTIYTYEDWTINQSKINNKWDKYWYINDKEWDESIENKWWKDAIVEYEWQNPWNNDYLKLDLEVKNLNNDKARIKYLEKKWYKVNKNGFYEKNWVKTKVYKDWRYNPKTEEIAKWWIWVATKNIKTNPQDDIDILLQEQWYKWPRNASWHFIPMNEDTLNWAWDREEKKETKKTKSSPLKKANKETKKEDNKDTNKWKKLNIVKWSETIKNLLKSKK
jgi:hypothetical protein